MSVDEVVVKQKLSWKEKTITVLGIFLMSSYFAAIFVSNSGELKLSDQLSQPLQCDDQSWSQLAAAYKNPEQACPSIAEVIVDIQSIDASDTAQMNANLRIWPAGELGSATVSTGIPQRALDVAYENINQSEWYVAAKRLIGGRSIAIPLSSRSEIEKYPFDQYQGDWQAEISPAGEYSPFLSSLTIADRDLYGWTVTLSPMPFESDETYQKIVNDDGQVGFKWSLERSGTFKISVVILILVMILGVGAAFVLTLSIVRQRRPPTLNALSWLATSLFALVEIRSRFPGQPPLGVRLDAMVTYPMIALLLFLIVLHTYLWIKRDDWNMKNVYAYPN